MDFWGWVVVLLIIIALITFGAITNIVLWFRALMSGAYVPLGEMISITIKKLNAKSIVNNYIKAKKAGVNISIIQIENHIQAHGNIERVINALIAAYNAGIDLKLETAIAVDLAGRDISDAVKHRIMPQTIQINNITAIAKNGIEVSVNAKVTLRVNLERIIGGALEETIIARISEGIMTVIGNANTHSDISERPDLITKRIKQNQELSKDTAFDILSIDIVEIKVGRNVGAEMEIDKAEAEKIIRQADAEKRRAEALASEQEMRALTQEMRASVVQAESEVPRALAGALKQGNITYRDYLQYENIKSDSMMRKAIGGGNDTDMITAGVNPVKKKTKLQ